MKKISGITAAFVLTLLFTAPSAFAGGKSFNSKIDLFTKFGQSYSINKKSVKQSYSLKSSQLKRILKLADRKYTKPSPH